MISRIATALCVAFIAIFSNLVRADTDLAEIRVDGYVFPVPETMIQEILDNLGPEPGKTRSPSKDDESVRVCRGIKHSAAIRKCNLKGYPAIPGFTGYRGGVLGAAYGSNACGGGPWTTAFASIAQNLLHFGNYSHDFNKPVKNNPNLDFSQACIGHDVCYTTNLSDKGRCDSDFSGAMLAICDNGSTSDAQSACKNFAGTYYNGVVQFGGSAFAADQNAVQCNMLGRAAQRNGC